MNQFLSKCAWAPTNVAKKDWTRSKFLLGILGKPLCNIIFISFRLGYRSLPFKEPKMVSNSCTPLFDLDV
jgi:hypothetical protein